MEKTPLMGPVPCYISLDLGNGAMKLSSGAQQIQILSQVAVANGHTLGKMLGLASSRAPLRVEIPDVGSFYVDGGSHDAGRPVENMGFDRFSGTPEMRALFYGALTRFSQQQGLGGQPLSLMCGLPLQALAKEEGANTGEAIQRWMKGEHHWSADGTPFAVQIVEVKATSQPAGALFDYLLDDAGQLIPERRPIIPQETGIISIGMNTLEIMVVRDRAPVDRFTVGVTSGVRRLLDILNPQQLYSLGELDLQLRAGKLDLSAALPVWEREVIGEIEKRWGSAWRRFSAVLLAGGGALLLKNSLPYKFKGKGILLDDPVFAIARGLWKLSQYQQQRRGGAA